MEGNVFIDTNVLVYYFQVGSSKKKSASRKIITENFDKIIISVQVLGELFNALKKLGASSKKCTKIIERCNKEFIVYSIKSENVLKALDIHNYYSYSYYDCLIIATALLAD